MSRMVFLKSIIKRIRYSKAVRWHKDYLNTKDVSHFTLIGSIWLALFFGHSFQATYKVILLGAAMYIVNFWIWTAKHMEEKEYIKTENPFKEENIQLEK